VTALLLSPHNDDAVLFASWLCLKHRPHVVTVLRSVVQEANGIPHAEREAEDTAAFEILGVTHEQWWFPDTAFDTSRFCKDLIAIADMFDAVCAPWPEPKNGNPHHDQIGKFAQDIFGDRVTFYTTYRVGGTRTVGVPSEPEPWMIPLKLRALACYESQMLRGPRRFFMHALDEWTMP
jgi:LmbE family N-acetylglucosaminyl deacetylase